MPFYFSNLILQFARHLKFRTIKKPVFLSLLEKNGLFFFDSPLILGGLLIKPISDDYGINFFHLACSSKGELNKLIIRNYNFRLTFFSTTLLWGILGIFTML